ncbi:TPA: tail fiber domain-containing protein [Aeromonas hydrophila subsp. hydrophila]|nr:tail fiber domain-containing protein [Aeromonas hydrophila subsp. hydrophila]
MAKIYAKIIKNGVQVGYDQTLTYNGPAFTRVQNLEDLNDIPKYKGNEKLYLRLNEAGKPQWAAVTADANSDFNTINISSKNKEYINLNTVEANADINFKRDGKTQYILRHVADGNAVQLIKMNDGVEATSVSFGNDGLITTAAQSTMGGAFTRKDYVDAEIKKVVDVNTAQSQTIYQNRLDAQKYVDDNFLKKNGTHVDSTLALKSLSTIGNVEAQGNITSFGLNTTGDLRITSGKIYIDGVEFKGGGSNVNAETELQVKNITINDPTGNVKLTAVGGNLFINGAPINTGSGSSVNKPATYNNLDGIDTCRFVVADQQASTSAYGTRINSTIIGNVILPSDARWDRPRSAIGGSGLKIDRTQIGNSSTSSTELFRSSQWIGSTGSLGITDLNKLTLAQVDSFYRPLYTLSDVEYNTYNTTAGDVLTGTHVGLITTEYASRRLDDIKDLVSSQFNATGEYTPKGVLPLQYNMNIGHIQSGLWIGKKDNKFHAYHLPQLLTLNVNAETVTVQGELRSKGLASSQITVRGTDGGNALLTATNGVLLVNGKPVSGAAGATGPQGPKGDTGATGPAGPQGPQGIQGLKGDKGEVTFASLTAAQKDEIRGPKGDTGPQGVQGLQGPKGDTGIQGPKGDTGLQGPIGLQGPKGDTGDTGATGPQGPQGIQGFTGPMGPKGDKGDTGPQGPKGDQGPMGPFGPQGPKGDQGIQGVKGDTGATGPQGPAGKDGQVTFASLTAEQVEMIRGPKGDNANLVSYTGTVGINPGSLGDRSLIQTTRPVDIISNNAEVVIASSSNSSTAYTAGLISSGKTKASILIDARSDDFIGVVDINAGTQGTINLKSKTTIKGDLNITSGKIYIDGKEFTGGSSSGGAGISFTKVTSNDSGTVPTTFKSASLSNNTTLDDTDIASFYIKAPKTAESVGAVAYSNYYKKLFQRHTMSDGFVIQVNTKGGSFIGANSKHELNKPASATRWSENYENRYGMFCLPEWDNATTSDVGLPTESAGNGGHVKLVADEASIICQADSKGTSTGRYAQIMAGNYITVNQSSISASVSISSYSDERLKKNIVNVQTGVDVVSKLRPVGYEFKSNDKHEYGFIAQELREVVPECVTETGMTVGEVDNVLAVNYTGLIPFLTKAIQEQQEMINALKAEIEKLKNI